MKVTNVTLWVQDNTLSEKFYKKLGFLIEKSDDTHSVVSLADFQIHLVSMRDEAMFSSDSMSSEKGKGAYLYVLVDEVDRFYAELLARGVKPRSEPRDWDWGNREFIVKDPDDYKLCFYNRIKTSNIVDTSSIV